MSSCTDNNKNSRITYSKIIHCSKEWSKISNDNQYLHVNIILLFINVVVIIQQRGYIIYKCRF